MKKVPLHQKMKDALWNRIRAINDDGQAEGAPLTEAGENNNFLENFKDSLAQERQSESKPRLRWWGKSVPIKASPL